MLQTNNGGDWGEGGEGTTNIYREVDIGKDIERKR